ncbi:phage holin family protein [Candidatus Saccharibacteria bacterium]|jgi:putative membrane protein|nr:phage holin family protein [Candidatus Saccharibacteria bacterium]HPR09742.1 phage holin family protein [Candidatus Saccharibacteria bacterium]
MDTYTQRGFLASFVLRWAICSLGLWVAAGLLGGSVNLQDRLGAVVIAGAILALINVTVKPLLILLSVPFIVLSLGLFMAIINGLTVYLASKLYTPLQIENFGAAIVAGLVIGLVNYLVTAILDKS